CQEFGRGLQTTTSWARSRSAAAGRRIGVGTLGMRHQEAETMRRAVGLAMLVAAFAAPPAGAQTTDVLFGGWSWRSRDVGSPPGGGGGGGGGGGAPHTPPTPPPA